MLHNFGINILSEDGKRITIDPNIPTNLLIDDRWVLNWLKDKIIQVAVSKNTIIIVTDHPELHSQISYSMPEEQKKGNVFAINTNGALLWRIEDMIGAFKVAFCIVYVVSEKSRKNDSLIFGVSLEKEHDYCVCANALDEYYLIDLTEKRLVSKKTLRT